MIDMPVFPCPFVRSIEGARGTVLLRRNRDHAARAAEAIQRRDTPAWSAGQGGRRWTPPVIARRIHRRKGEAK